MKQKEIILCLCEIFRNRPQNNLFHSVWNIFDGFSPVQIALQIDPLTLISITYNVSILQNIPYLLICNIIGKYNNNILRKLGLISIKRMVLFQFEANSGLGVMHAQTPFYLPMNRKTPNSCYSEKYYVRNKLSKN